MYLLCCWTCWFMVNVQTCRQFYLSSVLEFCELSVSFDFNALAQTDLEDRHRYDHRRIRQLSPNPRVRIDKFLIPHFSSVQILGVPSRISWLPLSLSAWPCRHPFHSPWSISILDASQRRRPHSEFWPFCLSPFIFPLNRNLKTLALGVSGVSVFLIFFILFLRESKFGSCSLNTFSIQKHFEPFLSNVIKNVFSYFIRSRN